MSGCLLLEIPLKLNIVNNFDAKKSIGGTKPENLVYIEKSIYSEEMSNFRLRKEEENVFPSNVITAMKKK